jgi:hypothetical protein
MNIYFLVEGRRTEKKVYPKWISILLPELSEVKNVFLVKKNNYLVFTGNGFPSLLDNHLRNAISEVNSIGNFDYFVICLDADEFSTEERENEVLTFINKENINLIYKTKLIIIVQNRCIETWFLGNLKVFKRNPNSNLLQDFISFYNVSKNDPEKMGKFEGFEIHADFHETYLTEMLLERNIKYTKNNPRGVTEPSYVSQLINRTNKTGHIQSFKHFLEFCKEVKTKINIKGSA